MRGLLGFICLLLLGICAGLAHFTIQTETNAARWVARVNAIENVDRLNREVLQSLEYAQMALEATRSLALENGLLCEREAKVSAEYAVIEEENRALKASLTEAVQRLEAQVAQINELMRDNESMAFKIQTLERALKAIEDQKKIDAAKEASADIVRSLNDLKDAASVLTVLVPLLL